MKIHLPGASIEDAQTALQMLKEGNERYLRGELIDKGTYRADREILSVGQKPFAGVLTCADSRVAPEIYFDQRLGDIFVVRNAGNVADTIALGSLEYAVEVLKIRLIVVCGHSKCGAVAAVCSHHQLPENINHIADQIRPAAQRGGDAETVTRNNVEMMAARVRRDMIVQRWGVTVVGACYDIQTGVVQWL
jgi:carbonic anhydrase